MHSSGLLHAVGARELEQGLSAVSILCWGKAMIAI